MTQDTAWFDAGSGLLRLDERIMAMPSYKRIMEDGAVTDAEIADHGARVADLLRKLEGMLSPGAHEVATEALCELAVLYAIQRQHEIQGISARRRE